MVVRNLLAALIVLAALAAGLACAEMSSLSKRTVWIIPADHQQTIQVQPGDVIELWTTPVPLLPDNLDLTFRASRVGQGVELIGDTLPHREGTIQRIYFFKAFDPGSATLKVELLNADGSLRDSHTYQVEVVPPEPAECDS